MIANVSINVKENGRHPPSWNVQSDRDGKWTLADLLKFTKGALIHIASDALKQEQARGFDKKPLTIVDGKYNRPVETVNPLGKIQFVARQNLQEVILYAYDAVYSRSPVDTGEYRNSNVVTHNGRQVANSPESLKAWLKYAEFSDKDKIRITNTAPYARKLELQGVRFGVTKRKWGKPGKKGYKTSYMNSKGQVRKPNGAYTLATKAIKAKYGRNALIKYELMLGSTIGLTGPGRVRKTGIDIGRPYVYPSILIYAVDASGPTTGSLLQ
jgi:hypothetical protein